MPRKKPIANPHTPKAKIVKSSYVEKKELERLMFLHSTPDPIDNDVRYWDNDHSPDTIAFQVGSHLNGNHVRTVARELNLTFKPRTKEAEKETLLRRIKTLEELITIQRDQIEYLRNHCNIEWPS